MNKYGNVSLYSSRNYQSNSTVDQSDYKPKTFQITLYSATGEKINTWTGRAIRNEDGVCKFYNEATGTLVQIVGTIIIE